MKDCISLLKHNGLLFQQISSSPPKAKLQICIAVTSDDLSLKKTSLDQALALKFETGPSFCPSQKVEPKPWCASKFYSLVTYPAYSNQEALIFWAHLKKLSLCLYQAWALLKMMSMSPLKYGKPKLNLGSVPSLIDVAK